MPGIESALIALVIIAFASALQASIGFGLALVAAPLLALVDRAYVPGPILCAGLFLGAIMTVRERNEIDLGGVGWAALGRFLGIVPAGFALHWASQAAFDRMFASLVLAAVAMSVLHGNLKPKRGVVFGAGLISGFMGTITSIGGPPLALAYQSASGPRLRATLAALFALGSVASIATLAVIGRFGEAEAVRGLLLVPGVLVGVLVSGPLLPYLDQGATRPMVLGLSTLSALAVLLRAAS
ncbi:MAG: TSUP family transporter [Myxococcota bacterium]